MSSDSAKALVNPMLALGALGGGDIYYQRKAMKEQKEARRKQQRLSEFQANQERRKQIRNAMRARAQVVNQAAQTGTSESSGVAGGTSAISSQAYGNIFSINTQRAYGRGISDAMQRSADYMSTANTIKQVKNTAMTIFGGMNTGGAAGAGSPGSTMQIRGQT